MCNINVTSKNHTQSLSIHITIPPECHIHPVTDTHEK